MIDKIKHSIFMQFLRHPVATGAICASSPGLCRELTSEIGLENAHAVAELGPGTGVVTRQILATLPETADFFAVELNTSLIPSLKSRFPKVNFYNESAEHLPTILRQRKVTCLDAVISGLPWAAFPDTLQDSLLNAIYEVLPERGTFVTFAYLQGMLLPAGIKFRRRLTDRFTTVIKSRVVWKNMPPAFVYRCIK